jgi:hypothetical protein
MTENPKAKTFNFGDPAAYSRDNELPKPSDDRQDTEKCNDYSRTRPSVGKPFIPYKRFHVLPMPDSLLQSTEVPPAAKLIFGRLCRYAGRKNYSFPTPATIGAEVGLGERQVQKLLSILQSKGFLRREAQFRNGKQISNRIVLLWHQTFEDWENAHPRQG